MDQDLDWLDDEVETFARRRDIDLTDEKRRILRDAMLWALEWSAKDALQWASPDRDDDKKWTKVERVVWDALVGFSDVTRAYIDRVRVKAGLPERDGKSIEESFKAAFSRRTS